MTQPVNPYVAGAPLRGERGFFGRQDTLDWVARELRNPATNALVLFGQRRIGKTTLLLQLQRALPTGAFLPIYFDLQDQATRSLSAVLADLADTVAEQADLEPPDPGAFDDRRGRFFHHTFLPGLYAVLGEARRPIFLFDEFDVLDQVAEAELPETAAAKAFFPFLRRTMREDSRPAFVFVVGRRAEDLSLDCNRTFKTSLVQYVWVLDRESAEALVRQAEANGTLHFTDRAVARTLSLTSCHPYLTQLLCQRIWERAYAGNPTAPPRIDAPEVEAAIPDALEAGDQALVWLWNGLGPAEKIYTAALAGLADEGATISEDQVIQVLSDHAARLRTREVELAPRDLVKRRVLEEAGEREYRFAVELFRRWVRRQKPLQKVKDELDRVDPLAGQLFGWGQGFFRRRQWEIAIRHFRDALDANPRHFRARLHLGEALLEVGQTDEAVAELERAYELDRDEARFSLVRALVAQAKAWGEAGDEDGALAACDQALQISPNERAAQEVKAAVLTQRGDAALERDDLEAALTAYWEAGDAEKIAQVKALQRQKEEELAHLFAEGMEALEQQDWRQAQRAFAEVVHRRPDYNRDGQLATRLLERIVARKKASALASALPFWTLMLTFVLLIILLMLGILTPTTPVPTDIPTVRVTMGISPENASTVQHLRTLEGQKAQVWSVAFSPDRATITSGSDDNTVRLWQVNDGTLLRTLEEHTSDVNSVAFSPYGTLLASGADDNTVRLWWVDDGTLLRTLKEHTSGVKSVAFSPDGATLASGSCGEIEGWICVSGEIHLWLVSDGNLLRILEEHTSWVRSVAFSSDGDLLASGADDKTVLLWRVNDGVLLHILEGHTGGVNSVAFSHDGKTLASGSDDNTVWLWRVDDGMLLHVLDGHTGSVNSVAFSPNGRMLASGSDDNTVRLWRVADGAPLRILEGHTGRVYSVAFSPDGALLASGSEDGTVRLWGVVRE